MNDAISRQQAIEAVQNRHIMLSKEKTLLIDDLEKLPPAQPEKQHGRIFQEIVVEYPSYNTYPEYKGKPYFSIKYTEKGQEFIGYGTYKPEVLSEYLKEYFMPSAQPEVKKISYIDCANAMLMMWMDEVLTDGEYNRIMDKLNAHWAKRREECVF